MTAKPLLIDITSPEELARLARLKYVLDDEVGFVRHMNGAGFQYLNGHGRRLRDARHINRIELLAMAVVFRGKPVALGEMSVSRLLVGGLESLVLVGEPGVVGPRLFELASQGIQLRAGSPDNSSVIPIPR